MNELQTNKFNEYFGSQGYIDMIRLYEYGWFVVSVPYFVKNLGSLLWFDAPWLTPVLVALK